jgi:hypothetical protein
VAYTPEEVASAVDRFLLRTVSVGVLPGGLRDVNAARDTVYDLLTTALALRPESYFYLIYLARNATVALVSKQIQDLDAIIAAAPGVSRVAKKVGATTELTNARAALADLSAGLNSRSTGVRDSLGPGVERFRRSVAAFVNTELTKNVIVSGEVTATAPELRTQIYNTWLEARERQAEILERIDGISSALVTLSKVSLSETAVATIVSRMGARLAELEAALSGANAVRESRSAMLDLLTMRSLLAKVSSFRPPAVVIMPSSVLEDPTAEFVDSPGIEGSIAGTNSAPFMYPPSTSLDLTVNGGTPLSFALPGYSNAEVRSQPLTFPGGPAANWELDALLNFTTSVGTTGTPPAWASGAVAAAALDAIDPLLDVSWDASESRLIFRSTVFLENSALEFFRDTNAETVVFVDWAFGGGLRSARVAPVEGEDVLAALSSPLVRAELSPEARFSALGVQTVNPDEVDLALISSSDGITDGTALSATGVNFVAAGVTIQMQVIVTGPPAVAGTYRVLDVGPQSLTLDTSLEPETSVTFQVGPVMDDLVLARAVISCDSSKTSGIYTIINVSDFVITLSHNMPEASDLLEVSAFVAPLTLSAVGTTTTSGIAAASSVGASRLGFSVSSEVRASLTRLSTGTDPLQKGVRIGATARLTSPTGVLRTAQVASVAMYELTVSPPVLFEPGVWTAEILSTEGLAWTTMVAALEPEVTGIQELDFAMSRLINGARYAGDVSATIGTYRTELLSQLSALSAYEVAADRGILSVVRMLQEQGFDRMLDMLMRLEIDDVFSMPRDGVSYATHLARTAATATRGAAPVSKYARSLMGYQEIRPTSFQLRAWGELEGDDE